MRSFSIPQQQHNQQTYERSIYHQVQSLQQQQQQQQSVENATVTYGEPLSVNGVPATGIYHNGTWYNAAPQFGPYQPADGQAPLQLVLQQAASQNVPQYEPQTYCYQPLQVQEAQPLGYATAYRPVEPQSSTNPQAYAYQQHSVQQSQSQSQQQQQQQQQQVVQLAPTYYYQPVQMVAGPPTGQPYVAASASLSQLIAAPANAQQQYVTAGSNVQQLIAAAPPNAQQMMTAPAPAAPPPSQLMEQPQAQQQLLSSSQSYNYQVCNYQDAPAPPAPVGLLPTPDMLPQTDEAFGHQCYNYSQPQSPRSPPPMPSYDVPPPMQLGSSTDYIEPETVEVDISMASDVFIARTPDKLVVSLYKLCGRRKPVPGTQNVYINGRVPDCTISQFKSDVRPDQASYRNGCHEQDLAVAAQSEATPDAPPAMEAAQCHMEPTEHVLCAQELPERMDSPPNAADQLAPGFQAFNVIDSSNLLECPAVTASRPMMEQNPLILCNADMEKKFNPCPNREAAPKPKDVDKKMDVVEQFRAPRRVNPISTQQLGLIRPCKSELVKNESKYLRNNYMPDVGRAAKQANKPQRQPEMIVKEILKPPPKLSTQEKNEKLLPELLNISSSKSFQANAESAQHINETVKPDSVSAAESFAVEPGEITDKLISQVFAGHIVAQLCQTASKFAAPQSTGKPTVQGNSNGTLSIFKLPAQVSPATVQENFPENLSPIHSILKLPAQVSLSTIPSSQINSNATQSNLKLHSPEVPEAAAPKTTQLVSPTATAETPQETPKTTQATDMQAAPELPKAVLKISQESSKTVSKAAKALPQISKKKAKLLARKNQKPFQPQTQHQIQTKSVLQIGAKPTPKLSQTNYKTTPEFNPKTTKDNQKTTTTNFKMSAEAAPKSTQATSKISAQVTQKTSQPSSNVLAEANPMLAPVASKLPAEENQKTTETNSKSLAEEDTKLAQVHPTILTQGTQNTSAEVSPKSTQEAAKLPTQEDFKLPAQIAFKLPTKENQKTAQTSCKQTTEETAKVVQDNPKTTSKATQKILETLQTSPPNSKLSPELIPKATEVAFDLPTQIVSRLPAQEYQKTLKPSSKLSPEKIPTQDNQKIFQPSSKLIPDVTLSSTQVASRLFTSENQKLTQTISKGSPEVSPRTSQLKTKCSPEVSPKASDVAFKVPAQVRSKLLSQGNPKLLQPISQLPSQKQAALSDRPEKVASELTRSTTQIFSQNKSQLVDATLKCIPLRGASSIILAPSKAIKSLAAKWSMPEKAVGAESKPPTQVAAKPSPELKIVSEVAQPKLKLTPVGKSEVNTIKAIQKPIPEDKSEAEIKQAQHLIASTNLGFPSKFDPTQQDKPIEQKTSQFKAASEGVKLVPIGNQTVELKRNQIKWASEGPASVELMANQIKVASVVSEPVELDLKLVSEDAESEVPETYQIKFTSEGGKLEENQALDENQLKSTAEDALPVEHDETQAEIPSEGARLIEPELNQYAESVDKNHHEYIFGTPEHSNLNTSKDAMQSELTANPIKLAKPEGAEAVELQSKSNIAAQTSCEQGADKSAYQEKLKSGSKKQYLAHPTLAVPETNQTTSLEQAGKPSTKPKPRKIDDLMLNVISAEEPIQPFGVQQQQSISKKKPAKLSKLERKALRREANKAQHELQAAQKAEEMARAGAERIPNDEAVREPKRKKKKKNINSDTEEVQEDDRNEDSGSEPEIECPALKEVCDPILRRKLMTIIHKIVNL